MLKTGRTNLIRGECGKVPEILKKSIAVFLAGFGNESGPVTVEKILEVLHDEYFDLKDFLQTVTYLIKFQQITKEIIGRKN